MPRKDLDRRAKQVLASVHRDLDRCRGGSLPPRLAGELYVEVRKLLTGGVDQGAAPSELVDDLAVAIYLVMVNEGPTDPRLLAELRRSLRESPVVNDFIPPETGIPHGRLRRGGDS